jgi:hypothetical protein
MARPNSVYARLNQMQLIESSRVKVHSAKLESPL